MDTYDSDKSIEDISAQDIDFSSITGDINQYSELVKDFTSANDKAKELLEVESISLNPNTNLVEESLPSKVEGVKPEENNNLEEAASIEKETNTIDTSLNQTSETPIDVAENSKNTLNQSHEAISKWGDERQKSLKQEIEAANLAPVPDINETPSEKNDLNQITNTSVAQNKEESKKNIPIQNTENSARGLLDIFNSIGNTSSTTDKPEPESITENNTNNNEPLKQADNQIKNKYELPELEEPEWATKLSENLKNQQTAEATQEPLPVPSAVSTLENFSETPAIEPTPAQPKVSKAINQVNNRPDISGQIQSIFKGLNDLSPALDVFNFKAFVNQGIKEGAAMRGVPQIQNIPDVESILKQLPFVSSFLPQEQEGEETATANNSFNFNAPSFMPEIGQKEQPEKLTSNSDVMLQDMSQNINRMSVTLQQTQQSLTASLNNLNNTANEILRTIPTISMQQSNTSQPQNNKGKFSPTEELNLIGKFRDGLNLAPRQYTNNTVFPGNNSIV